MYETPKQLLLEITIPLLIFHTFSLTSITKILSKSKLSTKDHNSCEY